MGAPDGPEAAAGDRFAPPAPDDHLTTAAPPPAPDDRTAAAPPPAPIRRTTDVLVRAAPWVVAGLALAIRLYRADAQSLWYDEGTSAQLARRSVTAIVAAAAGDIHPPLYYLLLAGWSQLLGTGVVALRALSAVLGAATAGAVVVAARARLGGAVAVVAGLGVALSPYLIWYGQEVRMYVLAGALAAALVVAVGALDARPRGRAPRAAVVGLAAAALYTQYLAGAAAVAVAAAVAALDVARRFAAGRADRAEAWRRAATLAALLAIAAAVFVPWLWRAWPALRDWPALGAPVGLGFLVRETLATYAFGIAAPPAWRARWPALAAVAAAGAAAGLGPWAGASRRWGTAAAVAWAAAPPALVGLASLRRPAWNAKFVIAGAPGFELLLALAVVAAAEGASRWVGRRGADGDATTASWTSGARSARVAGAAAGLIVAALVLWPRLAVWHANAFDPAFQRDDYRGIAAAVAARAGPDDVVVLNAPTQIEVFDLYDRGAHATAPLPIGRPVDVAATDAALADLGARHRDVFAVLWATAESDPDGRVEAWLNDARFKVEDRWYGRVRLAVWAAERSPAVDALPPGSRPTFGGRIALRRAAVGPAPGESDRLTDTGDPVRVVVAPGGIITIDACWSAVAPPAADVTVFTHLLDAAGTLVAGRDMPPRGGTERTGGWPADDAPADPSVIATADHCPHRDRIGLAVPPDLAPGDGYRLRLGLYDAATGERWTVGDGGDGVEVGRVRVGGSGDDG